MKSYHFDGHKLMYHPERVAGFLGNGDCYPLYIEISPVGSCNHRCIFCAYDYIGYPNRKLETGRTLDLIDELADCGLKSMLLAGEGEPLLHPDIAKFAQRANSRGIDVGLFSNGQLLSREMAEALLPALTFVRFSFNGGDRDTYAKVHRVRKEVFPAVVEAVRNAAALKRELGLTVAIGAQFVLIPENMDTLADAATILRDTGADYLAVKPFVQQSQLQVYQMPQPLQSDEIARCIELAEERGTDEFKVIVRSSAFAGYGARDYCHCYGTSFISVLNSAGDVATCLPYWDKKEYVFGNIHEGSFAELWHGERRKAIKEHVEKTLDARQCPPNCRPHAINSYLSELMAPSVEHINFI